MTPAAASPRLIRGLAYPERLRDEVLNDRPLLHLLSGATPGLRTGPTWGPLPVLCACPFNGAYSSWTKVMSPEL